MSEPSDQRQRVAVYDPEGEWEDEDDDDMDFEPAEESTGDDFGDSDLGDIEFHGESYGSSSIKINNQANAVLLQTHRKT